ncbi:Alpha/Beta hydrolase protein [Triangularia setosa]|uniref:Alpha/Beta hydrolase protein n=1 Tax=Triangularia setosa TaxID=2587417 RepID=A0AAN6WHU0_9PEZI|nr:Alpha/Beta hydrolase protein [Podospora setosa]
MSNPGLLYVTMEPRRHDEAFLNQFHEWYQNEHGPTRLRLPHIFPNGFRYRATDSLKPEFLAIYDVTEMRHLETPVYTQLRENRTKREGETIGQVDVDRRFFDLLGEQAKEGFTKIEDLSDQEAEGQVLVAVEVEVKGGEQGEKEITKWYLEEHIPMLSKIPGWLRSRVYRTPSLIEGGDKVRIVTLHEYEKVNGLGGEEHKASMDTKWRTEVFDKWIAAKHRRTYELFYVFGPGPRELETLSKLSESKGARWEDGKIETVPGKDTAAVNAYVYAQDGLTIRYRLEGNVSPKAPTVAFSNSLLTDYHMWDELVAILKAARPDLRILRYDTRGRHEIPSPPVPATLDMLADDLRTLLKGLRIEKLRALVGVSMGGATTLKFALKYPELVDKIVACDFNVASSDANTAAWKDRIVVAEKNIKDLAGVTVERWFHPHTMTEKPEIAKWMTDMVAGNNVEGFKYSCQALWGYNMREEMKGCKVDTLFVVGDGDGKGALVKAMEGFKANLGEKGAELKIVPNAGHLPMSEAASDFWEAIKEFL